jgi:CRISPR-associated endonuclease/helicase Cas3
MSQLFYSHSKKNEAGRKQGSKPLADHTQGVLTKAQQALYPKHGFSLLKGPALGRFMAEVCRFHDLGKYTSFFQRYLLGEPVDWQKKSHARLGAHVLFQRLLGEESEALSAILGYYLVLHHHLNLRTLDSSDDGIFGGIQADDIIALIQEQWTDLSPHQPQIQDELGLDGELAVDLPAAGHIRKTIRKLTKAGTSVEHYFLINYLFSLLIEADKLDASDTLSHLLQPLPIGAVDRRIAGFQGKDSPYNRLRTEVRQAVLANLERPDILDQRLMLLTAPTGIGKTLTALDFALKLRHRIWQEEGRQAQIITALPFINIIEQTLSEYQQVFAADQADNPKLEVIAHYQYADVLGDQREASDDKQYQQKVMQLDTWQADVVITSFVQLLQTLITNRNKLLKKFNHLAGAIVIMDEVQSIKLDDVPLVGAMLYYLSEYLGTRLIMMTATQPLIFELADQQILKQNQRSASTQVLALLPNAKQYFSQFQRTQLVPHLTTKLADESAFVQLFAQHWQPQQACLIVCNKVSRSLAVYQQLTNWLSSQGLDHPIHYLSTNVIPAHRLDRIKTIKGQLDAARNKPDGGYPPILVATQVVEAGVDLDFDLGFRDLGPIDSIVQVAGRLNRENSPDRAHTPLHVVDFGDCHQIYGKLTDEQARKALGAVPIPEEEYYDLVSAYFDARSNKSAFKASKRLFASIQQLNYDGPGDFPIAKFAVIPDANHAASVFIEWDETASAARQAFLALNQAKGEAKQTAKRNFELHHKRSFHQHIIAVPKYYVQDQLEKIDPTQLDLDIYLVPNQEIATHYHFETGFRREAAPPLNTPTLCF